MNNSIYLCIDFPKNKWDDWQSRSFSYSNTQRHEQPSIPCLPDMHIFLHIMYKQKTEREKGIWERNNDKSHRYLPAQSNKPAAWHLVFLPFRERQRWLYWSHIAWHHPFVRRETHHADSLQPSGADVYDRPDRFIWKKRRKGDGCRLTSMQIPRTEF